MGNGPLISVDSLSKTYTIDHQKIVALEDISLSIHEKEFVALTGSSGSGKSTLLQMIGGLDRPSDGSVLIDGTDLNTMSDSRLAKFRGQKIGFVFQFFYLQPFLRLRQNLEVPGMFTHTRPADRHARIETLAETVGLTERLNHFPGELSGGQMQRAAIARALLNNPRILLADEPTGNLDSKNGALIIDLFEKIRQDLGTTIIVVTHDSTIASRADRTMVLKDGRLHD